MQRRRPATASRRHGCATPPHGGFGAEGRRRSQRPGTSCGAATGQLFAIAQWACGFANAYRPLSGWMLAGFALCDLPPLSPSVVDGGPGKVAGRPGKSGSSSLINASQSGDRKRREHREVGFDGHSGIGPGFPLRREQAARRIMARPLRHAPLSPNPYPIAALATFQRHGKHSLAPAKPPTPPPAGAPSHTPLPCPTGGRGHGGDNRNDQKRLLDFMPTCAG